MLWQWRPLPPEGAGSHPKPQPASFQGEGYRAFRGLGFGGLLSFRGLRFRGLGLRGLGFHGFRVSGLRFRVCFSGLLRFGSGAIHMVLPIRAGPGRSY